MNVGIGLSNTASGGTVLVEWAHRMEARGFATLATMDRIVYPRTTHQREMNDGVFTPTRPAVR